MDKSNKPIIKYIPDFLDYCEIEKGLSDRTLSNYDQYLRKFVFWLKNGQKEGLLPHELTPDDIWAYRLYLSRFQGPRGLSLKKTTQNYYLIALRALLRYFTAKDIVSLPADKVTLPKNANKEKTIKFLNLDQIEKLLLAPDISNPVGLRDRAILESFFSTGLRIAELVSLNVDQFANLKDKKDLEISIVGKGDYPRTVYFSERALEWIKKYLQTRKDKEKALFIHYRSRHDADSRLTPRSIERTVKKYAIAAGVPVFTTPHTIRHCLHPLTRIATADSILSARDLFFERTGKVNSIKWQTMKLNNVEIISKNQHITPLYSIWADGYNLVCSPKHRLFTLGSTGIKEVTATAVKVGDYLMAAKGINIKGKEFIDPKLARLLGYVLGDGVVNNARRVVIIHDKNRSFLEYYSALANKIFKTRANITKRRGENSYELRIYSQELVSFLLSNGYNVKSNQKRMPKSIMSSSKEEVKEFIAGFYDAEGNSGTIRLFSSSLDLLKDIQISLLRFKIDSHINERQRTVMLPQKRLFSHLMYTLEILHKPDQTRFLKLIKTLKSKSITIQPDFEGEKVPAGKILLAIRKDTDNQHIFWSEKLKNNYGINHLARYFNKLQPVRNTLKRIIMQLEDVGYHSPTLDELKKITYSESIKWLKIKKKTRLPWGRYCTYDFGVAPTQSNLVTDGIISHNSYATDLLTQGVDLRSIQEFLGHRSILTTQIYTHVTNKRLRDIHRQFHSGKNLKE